MFYSFILCSIIYLFEKRKGAYCCLPSKDSLNDSLSLSKGLFHLWSLYSVQNAFVHLHIYRDLLKLKAYKLLENSDADLSQLLFFKEVNFLSLLWSCKCGGFLCLYKAKK